MTKLRVVVQLDISTKPRIAKDDMIESVELAVTDALESQLSDSVMDYLAGNVDDVDECNVEVLGVNAT